MAATGDHVPSDHILDEFLGKHGVKVKPRAFGVLIGNLRKAFAAEAEPRWWICTYWLRPQTEAPGVKIAGPFRSRDEALENRARIEKYTSGRTFYVDEETHP